MRSREKEKPQPRPGLQILTRRYAILTWIADFFGSVFWWAEQRRWKIADQLEDLEALQR